MNTVLTNKEPVIYENLENEKITTERRGTRNAFIKAKDDTHTVNVSTSQNFEKRMKVEITAYIRKYGNKRQIILVSCSQLLI